MAEINFILYLIIVLFFLFLAIKSLIKKDFCVICASISLTWIILLILYSANFFDNVLIISLLIGMSVTGVYYLAERKIGKINKKLKMFRLPFILTLIIIAYHILTLENIINSFLITGGLWIFFFLMYFYNNTKFTKKLLECCKE